LLLQRKKLQRVSQIVLKGRGFEPRRKDFWWKSGALAPRQIQSACGLQP